MQPAIRTALAAAVLALATAAQAQEPRIGLSAPLDGPFALLGAQMRDGAAIAARQAGVELVAADDSCTGEGGAAAGRDLAEAGAAIVVGFLCFEAVEAALPALAEAGIAVITPGVRANGLTDRRGRTGWPVWRLAPRADAEARAIADILPRRWRGEHFAILDDGTIHGRELVESLRLAAEMAGLRPILVDTYRPQVENQIGLVGRLARAGASHVFVGGDRDDVAIMARDAAGLGHELTFAGGEALRAAGDIALAEGTLMVGLPEWADMIGESEAERFAEARIEPEGYVAAAHAAVEIAAEALRKARDGDAAIADILARDSFETLIGPVSFDEKGDMAQSRFVLQRYDGERFVPVD